jgi:hypothetical protein
MSLPAVPPSASSVPATPQPASSGPPPAADPQGAPPPAAKVVAQGRLSEADAGELVRLRQERDELASAKKAREMRLAELEDENHRLKSVPASVAPPKKGLLDHVAEFFPKAD